MWTKKTMPPSVVYAVPSGMHPLTSKTRMHACLKSSTVVFTWSS